MVIEVKGRLLNVIGSDPYPSMVMVLFIDLLDPADAIDRG